MTYHMNGLGAAPTSDPWTVRKQQQYRAALARVSAASGFGQDVPAANPPAVAADSTAVKVGWVAVVALAAGLFYFTVNPPRQMTANRRRRMRRNFFGPGSGRYELYGESGKLYKRTNAGYVTLAQELAESKDEGITVIDSTTGKEMMFQGAPLHMNRLTEKQRKRIPLRAFVFPERRAWPIDTKARAYAAMQMLRMGRVKSASEYHAITQAIMHRYPGVWREFRRGLSWQQSKRAKSRRVRHRAAARVAANRRRG